MTASRKIDPIQGEIVHEYDGILEADNRLPSWWLVTLFGAIVFAAVYWGWYEVFRVTPSTEEAYAAAMTERALAGADPSPDVLAAVANDPANVATGAATFASQCAACHGASGEGVIGPNLTDSPWIHGGEPLDIYRVVRDGVGARGMPTWGPVLGPRGVLAATAFVLSIRGTNLPGRAPEGPRDTPEPE